MDLISKFPCREALNFSDDIDLWDETLREGAERSVLEISISDKLEIAEELSNIGIKTIVVGMFPDVPHNIELLTSLIECKERGDIANEVRFVIISHVGETYRQTTKLLKNIGIERDDVVILCIHSVSDDQINHLYPTIYNKGDEEPIDFDSWYALSTDIKRKENISWLELFMLEIKDDGFRKAVGLLDFYRADETHVRKILDVVEMSGIKEVRLVDTAGTCRPDQVTGITREIVSSYPYVKFHGHFHNDFGMATGNAVLGLSVGLKGVDVSIGGFANRAGHPPIAEVLTSLHYLYSKDIGMNMGRLYQASRLFESKYGVIETVTAPATGLITCSVSSGIRTELVARCKTIFDVLDPEIIGSEYFKVFGVRSGIDGLKRLVGKVTEEENLTINEDVDYESLYEKVYSTWQDKSTNAKKSIFEHAKRYQNAILDSQLSEKEVEKMILDIVKKDSLQAVLESEGLASFVDSVLKGSESLNIFENHDLYSNVMEYCNELTDKALNKEDKGALRDLHLSLYKISILGFTPYSQAPGRIQDSDFLASIRKKIASDFKKSDELKYSGFIDESLRADNFEEWVVKLVKDHESNVTHPLFGFFEKDATLNQLKDFISQETPFDIIFADLLALMLCGVYGPEKSEMLDNFWDEMGHGVEEKMHRNMRINMMEMFGISDADYIQTPELYCTEELALANLYMNAAADRGEHIQLIGMMLATENMVPGRLQCQIKGWNRVGIDASDIGYLIEHTVVDVEHAEGWMENVVKPLIAKDKGNIVDLTLGVMRRLGAAGDVCNHFYAKYSTEVTVGDIA